MFTREQLINAVRTTLLKVGFYVSEKHNIRRLSFDIIARRDRILLIIKVLLNIDAITKIDATELRFLADTLNAAPLIVGTHTNAGRLAPGTLYSRIGIPALSKQTLDELFKEGVPPFVFAAPGGMYVKLDIEILKKAREMYGITLGTLAEAAGVSRKSIQMYCEGMGATIEVALRLERFLKLPVVVPINPFLYESPPQDMQINTTKFKKKERMIFKKLTELGYEVRPFYKCPFEAITKHKKTVLLTGIGKDEGEIVLKARTVLNISKIAERQSVIFIEEFKHHNIDGIPLIGVKELKNLAKSEDMLSLINERATSHKSTAISV
jgi:putative transcriptional regulator